MNIRHALLALAFCVASGAAFAQDASSTPTTDSNTPAAASTAAPADASATPAAADTPAPATAKAKSKTKHARHCKKGDVKVKGKCQPKKAG
jgi:hypothetical protein